MFELNNFDAIQIGLASPEQVRKWSRGEVKKPETINYRTLKPERDGLFCERIFGPMKDWECHCGKYKRVRYKGIVCDRCGVEVTKAKVRRERMGHIELAAPVSHIWYFKGIPSRMGLILDMSPRALEKILYFASYVVIDPKETPLLKKQLLNEKEYREAADKYGEESFVAGMGAEAVKQLLGEIDLEAQSIELKEELKQSTGQKKVRIIRRLEVIESFKKSGNDPKWMIIDVIPVIPPDLRPMVQLDGGRFATSDLNDLYRRVINRNNRLKKLLDLGAPDIIVRNEKRMLQEAVDALVDNGRRGRAVTGPGNRPLKSLSDMLKGKQGRFRQNLLGKRVDYSGRSVIVVGPELKMYQCGLPKEMALELFKPFVMKKLVEDGIAHNIKSAKRMVERVMPQVWDVLEEVIADHPVLLNRAPTLHRLGIQAFQPVLVEGRAIKLHPLVCTAYNADFDGDQMAVHVPLSVEAQAEARFLMLAAGNILKPSDGKPVCVPTQDMVLGSYYLTIDKDQEKEDKYFYSKEEAIMAYELKEIGVHDKIHVKLFKTVDGVEKTGIIKTTVGKLIFNESIPQDLGFVDRNNKDEEFNLEVDFLVTKKSLGKIIDKCYLKHGPTETSIMLDKIKALGYHYSSIGAITVAASDMIVPKEKYDLLRDADETIEKIEKMYKRGFISDDERYERVIEKWTKTTEEVADTLMESLDKFNPIFMMADSGARGSKSQIKQLAGMRGLMASPSGKIIELPIRASFREGLDVLEYFLSTHGARKGNADTALKTADSGYLTRRLVDVSQDVIVREEDCGATEGMVVAEIREGNEVVEGLAERLTGRYLAEDVINPSTGEVIASNDTYVDSEMAEAIVATGVKKVKIRSVFTCKCKIGVCAKCYGMNMATAKKINIGEAVGIIAAQSIGEPGTQLTMRTFHTGGVAGADITQGLPRVEELFEARKPKGLAIVSEISGTVRIEETKKKRTVYVMGADGEEKSYDIPFGSRLKVNDNDVIEAGDEVTEGSVNPHDIMSIKGIDGARRYLLSEVQKVYRLQGVDINDKHLEVVVRQMTRKIKVTDSGDTELLPGTMIDIFDFEEANEKVREFGGEEATGEQALLGITKAALATDSFLSAASFQETTRVLTEAAIKGKTDPLVGLKENVIIGKLIPAGTGMMRYRSVKLDVEEDLTMDDSLLKVE
ncbi:DNA-directed RNA polymerase subunit beta' [Clostridium paraputrificum]|uniref:DNA-directed RNA polymerase subunit beta' n=1 Tax=Clostridium TaxID=1485 RepID=UPI0029001263|nr:DNA-directed RNA polymerase subunit beta' [Clostridium sp.]MBS7132620.1 DNA-directed RNA polymerase subunit beta' [Clostridium sp.]MDU1034448.1 DNA-directed RNA polymerase subunit beta' [Clostridium sp.]MDU2285317.1 DNA-directed RNA polymerase subunit beta' [Clostridium sp.]MDU4939718.1 DNA-directed RNA polymerase subunit beta' [Clostridium sp.]MDU5742279.1 DNA-directed RNA polymerase subunit beta' [Clostridium sp.]